MKIKEVKPNIFVAIIPDDYERAMTFCRVQEFYESPKFRTKKFSIWDYYRWYSKKFGSGCFSYPKDFTGFNLPVSVAENCYKINKPETPYDFIMIDIIKSIKNKKKQYLIGVDSVQNLTFKHELAHALYYTNDTYKEEMDKLINTISKQNMLIFKKNLKLIGYCSQVIDDEIQAYMSTEINKKVVKGILRAKNIHNIFKLTLEKYM